MKKLSRELTTSFGLRSLVALAILISALNVLPARADGKIDKTTASTDKVYIIAVPSQFPPYYIVRDDGSFDGFAIDIANEISAKTGLQFSYQLENGWRAAFDALEVGRVDLIVNLGITADRKKKFDFTRSYETLRISMFVRSDSEDITSSDQLEEIKVGAVEANAAVKILNKRPGVDPIVYKDLPSAFFGLITGEVDALVYPEAVAWKLARETGLDHRFKVVGKPLKEIKRAIAVKKGNAELLDKLEQAVAALVISEEYKTIYKKWYSQPEPYWSPTRIMFAMGGFIIVLSIGFTAWRYRSVSRLNLELQENVGALETTETKLEELYSGLEKLVAERTEELTLEVKERRSAEQDLKSTLVKLESAQSNLVEAEKMASLGGLVAGVAHEINTPVGISVTAASHLQETAKSFDRELSEGTMTRSSLKSFNEICQKSSQIILTNLEQASSLIKSFKQVAVDQSSEEKRNFNFSEYVDEILLSLRPQLKKTNLEVVVDCDPQIKVDSYPGVISQVFTNLIMNSISHAYDDGEQGTIRIKVDSYDDTIKVSFSDDGKGIGNDNVKKIFDPFFTTKRGSGGSGLGLHILYNLVSQKLGGAVNCHSEVGVGTTFNIVLPHMFEPGRVASPQINQS